MRAILSKTERATQCNWLPGYGSDGTPILTTSNDPSLSFTAEKAAMATARLMDRSYIEYFSNNVEGGPSSWCRPLFLQCLHNCTRGVGARTAGKASAGMGSAAA
jgi:hypothetical protein